MEISTKEKGYKTSSHLTFSCQYHVIFCPKYRRKVLTGDVEARIKELFEEISNQYDFEIVELEVMPDHVHLLIDCSPRFGIMNCVTKLKGITSRKLRDEFPTLKSRIPTLWTRSAFISSVGSVSLEVVKKYIEEQKSV
ncbi:IS200/IS605 family transposase (plasmid) [Pontibacillus sp. ALD_SL1]|nr:IS200/IS605 family transposase [Pontibacillus sp. ALD_SL1]QST02497.1 IS200/IS605 family transposase [Pontibacillus sp. ALD_SL1]